MNVAACEIKREKSAKTVCRLCLTEGENYRLIFEHEYSSLHQWIENLLSLKIVNVQNAPASLCKECESTLHNFESFREMCFANDRVIKEMYCRSDELEDESVAASEATTAVMSELKTDQCEDTQDDIVESRGDYHLDQTAIKTEPEDCEDQQILILDYTIDSDVDNTEGPTEYGGMNIEVDSSVDSGGDCDDEGEHAETLVKLAKNQSSAESAIKAKKRYICNMCNKEFKELYRLKVHIRSHTQERPYKCEDCEKRFLTSSNMRRHMLIHSGSQPYICGMCPARYSQSSNLVRHKKLQH